MQSTNHNWRNEYKSLKVLSSYQIKLLETGPQSLSQSWIIGAMHIDWKRIKGIKEPEPPNCKSSFQEFNRRIENGNI